jgi:hypothetical protein
MVSEDLPLYAQMPDLFATEVVRDILRTFGIELSPNFNVEAHAESLRDTVRTAVTIGDGGYNSAISRRWHEKVTLQATELSRLLSEIVVVGWSACLEVDPLSDRAREIDDTIADLPRGLKLLAEAASVAAAQKGNGGAPSSDSMRSYLFAELAEVYQAMTGSPVQVRIAGVKRDVDAPAIKWVRALMEHAAECYSKADDDVFGSRDQAKRLREIAALSGARLVDLLEKGRAKKNSELPQ